MGPFLLISFSHRPLPQVLLLGDSASGGVFMRISHVFAGKNLVLVGEAQYNCRVAAHVRQVS